MSETSGERGGAVHPLAARFAFVDSKSFHSLVTWALGLGALGLALFDLVVHRHAYFAFERAFGFYAAFGFAAFAFVVLCGWPLRRLLGRPEAFYRAEDEHD